MLGPLFSKNITYTLKNKIKMGFAVSLSNSLLFAGSSLICYKKIPIIFAGKFGAGRAQVLRKLWAGSSAGCVSFDQNVRFLQKFLVFPCFLLQGVCVLADFVCATGRGI